MHCMSQGFSQLDNEQCGVTLEQRNAMSLLFLLTQGDISGAKMLLTKPEPIDWEIVDSNGATALHLAARRCNADIVQRLLEICPRGLCDRPTHDDGKPGSFTALQCAADLPRPPHWNEELRSAFKRTCAMLADAMSADGWCHVTTKGTTVSHPTHLFM